MARLGCGASASSSSSLRRTPSSRRSSVSASRPVPSTAAKASAARSGSRPLSRRAAPACTVIADRACATTSWSSLAIRVRSSCAAASASAARPRSSRHARSRRARLSRVRFRSSWPNSIGAPIVNTGAKRNAPSWFWAGSASTPAAASTAPIANASASRRPSSCTPAENAMTITTRIGAMAWSVRSRPTSDPATTPAPLSAIAAIGARRRRARPSPKARPAAAMDPTSRAPSSGVTSTSSQQISIQTANPISASSRNGGIARRRVRRSAMRNAW